MVITVDLQRAGDPAPVGLKDPEDFGTFHVEAVGVRDLAALGHALVDAAVGRIEGDDAFIEIGAIRTMVAGRVDESWADGFDKMVAFARSKGWLDPTETSIQAHVEWK